MFDNGKFIEMDDEALLFSDEILLKKDKGSDVTHKLIANVRKRKWYDEDISSYH